MVCIFDATFVLAYNNCAQFDNWCNRVTLGVRSMFTCSHRRDLYSEILWIVHRYVVCTYTSISCYSEIGKETETSAMLRVSMKR